MTCVSETSIDNQVSSTTDVIDSRASERSDTASSSSSFSIITLKESPDEADLHGRLSSLREAVSVDTAWTQILDSTEGQQWLNGSRCQPDGTSLSTTVTSSLAVADTLLTSDWDGGVVCDKDVTTCVFVDRLERRTVLKNKPKLKVTELTAEMFCYSPSFHLLPAIVESLRSEDGPPSDASITSGDGYVADGGHLKSSLSSTSSLAGSLRNVAMLSECNDDFRLLPGQQHVTHVSVNLSKSCDSTYTEHRLHLDCTSSSSEKIDTVVSDRRQLSAKSSSDGIDSAVVCTPYSTQTSQDSADTVDNTRGSCCHFVSDITDDQAVQPSRLVADEIHPVVWEKDELGHATMSRTAAEVTGRKTSREDSDDETSVTSLKVEWEVGSDSEMPLHSEAVVNTPSIERSMSLLPCPFQSTVYSVPSLEEQARESERHWNEKPVPRRSCCACVSSVIVRHRVSTAADVTPTISIRLCSSVVDVICLIQRLIVVSSTWLQVVCNLAFSLHRSCQSDDEQFSQETAIMCPTSVDHADGNMGIVRRGSENANQQYCGIFEGLKNVQDSRLQQLINVSDV